MPRPRSRPPPSTRRHRRRHRRWWRSEAFPSAASAERRPNGSTLMAAPEQMSLFDPDAGVGLEGDEDDHAVSSPLAGTDPRPPGAVGPDPLPLAAGAPPPDRDPQRGGDRRDRRVVPGDGGPSGPELAAGPVDPPGPRRARGADRGPHGGDPGAVGGPRRDLPALDVTVAAGTDRPDAA